MRTFGDGKYIYSVDMMLAYFNIFEHPVLDVNVSSLTHNLEYKCWGDKTTKYSPQNVLNNLKAKKYKKEYDRIKNADLRYPIIMHKRYIVDGVHRLCKSILDNKPTIRVYKINKSLLNKFRIPNDRQLEPNYFIEEFDRRFK